MDNKVIVISGGSEGLGFEIAKLLAWKNKVVILARDEEKLNAAASELECAGLRCDVSNFLSIKEVVKKIVEEYQKIDVLINNAGLWLGGEIDDNDPVDIKKVFEVNTLGVTLLTRETVTVMKQQGYGQIINIISQDGLYGKAGRSVYTASKWAVTGLTKSLQEELSPYGIRVSGIYPGLMDTQLFDGREKNRDMSTAMDPVEVAKMVEFVVNTPKEIMISEVGIKHIKN